MAFWSRLKRTQLIYLSTRFNGLIAVDNLTSRTGIPIINNSNSILHNIQLHFANNVRFYAAPVQAKEKKEEKDTSGPSLNKRVAAQLIRLVTDEGHSVVSRHEALKHAKSLKLDLVEVDRNAKPPVCKIVDYNKEKYQQQVKEKERQKSKCELKKVLAKKFGLLLMAVFKGEDDFNKVFDITDDANGFAKSSRHEKVTVLSSADASSGSVVDSARARTASSMSTEVSKTGTENRYARDPRNRNRSMSPGTRNTIDHVSQFSNHGTEIKFNKNMSPQAQQTWRVETPANKDRNRDSSQPGVPNSTAKSYGVFSAQQVDSNLGEQNTPAQVNRYANRNPSDSARSPTRIGVSHRNSPISDARTSRGAGVERTQMGSRTR